jgi:hypothetical protein
MFIYCANIHFGTLKGISRCNMILLDCIKMGGMSFILHKKNADGLRPYLMTIFLPPMMCCRDTRRHSQHKQ